MIIEAIGVFPFTLSLSKGVLVEARISPFLAKWVPWISGSIFFAVQMGPNYTGHTDNLEKRIAEHQVGEFQGYTRNRRPVTLVYSEAFQTREEALACERRVKGWSRKKKEAMMRGDWGEVVRLAKGKRPVR